MYFYPIRYYQFTRSTGCPSTLLLMRLIHDTYHFWLRLVPALLCTAAGACSIYFNTFYNAQTAFDDGYEIHEKVLRSFPDSIVVEPPSEAHAKYDRAIEKAAKILEVFPKDKKWHDDALFLLGKSFFYKMEFGKSIRRLRQLQEEYPQSRFIPESYIYCAKNHIGQDELAKAEETLLFALDRFPQLDSDQELSLLLVEIAIRREGRSQAIELLERARKGVRSPEKKQELLLRIAELYMGLGRHDEAIARLKKASRSAQDQQRLYRIDRNLVMCYVEINAFDKALAAIKTMLANKQYVPYTNDILFVKGSIFAHQGKDDEAIAVFKQIVGDLTDSTAVKNDTSIVVSKALYELGRMYQKRKGSYKKAEHYYTLLTKRNARDSTSYALANKRLKAMQLLIELRSKLTSKDTSLNRPQTNHAISELFYYDLDEPDSAFLHFTAMVEDTVRDTIYWPKSLYSAAYIARHDLKDTLRSDSLFKTLIAVLPHSSYAHQAQLAMGSPEPAKTSAEQAHEAFRNAEKAYLYEREIKNAVQMFYDVHKKYGDLDIGAKSLFVAAWLVDNELYKKKTAKSLYEKLCQRYPESIYCKNEAQPRLKVVLDTLEALRQKRKSAAAIGSAGSQPSAGKDSLTAIPADSLDDASTVIGDTAATTVSPEPLPDTGDAFTRRPGYRGNMPAEKPVPLDSLPK
ncbi:MAG: tetratricopeptide repeat protein [Chitinispirillaceae bacterium]|nr:tetratricopeptide repeat protein [Chitinispirillaceae bacterium]